MPLPITKYFPSELDVKQINRSFNNSNCTMDSFVPINNIPLRVLIRQMLEETFGLSNRTINVNEDRCNVENKSCEIDSSLRLLEDESISSHNETNDRSSLHESISDCTKHRNNKLISIEEESTNLLDNSDSFERTGIYLSKLLKSNDKPVDRIKRDNSLPSRSDTEIMKSLVDTDISNNDSFGRTNFVNDESSICQQNNDDRNESVMTMNTINSFNDADVSSNNENTAEFLNILKRGNSPETKQETCESLSSLKEDRTESSIDASLANVDYSVENTPRFISTLTLKRRTPTSSSNTNNKLFKTPCYNAALVKKPFQYRSSFYVTARNTFKTAKMNREPFKSHGIRKQKQMNAPQIILTPATPKSIF